MDSLWNKCCSSNASSDTKAAQIQWNRSRLQEICVYTKIFSGKHALQMRCPHLSLFWSCYGLPCFFWVGEDDIVKGLSGDHGRLKHGYKSFKKDPPSLFCRDCVDAAKGALTVANCVCCRCLKGGLTLVFVILIFIYLFCFIIMCFIIICPFDLGFD